jgi:aryl-alcohol dehydrogenase-like predicted oxidoreductase
MHCRASLERLQVPKLGLYMQHWPGFLINGPFNDAFVEGLSDCARLGLTQAVGVSNFSAERIRRANSILQAFDPPSLSVMHIFSLYMLEYTNREVKHHLLHEECS